MEKTNLSEVIKWGVFIGLIESLIIFGISLVWFNRNKIFPLPQGWEFAATIIIFALISISAVISTGLLVGHPCVLICRGKAKEGLWTLLAAGITLFLFILLIIFASRDLI